MFIVGTECGWDDFPQRAQAVIDHFGMEVVSKTDGLDERVWITTRGSHEFRVSWDTWVPEVSVMPWGSTSNEAIEKLITATCSTRSGMNS
ncbi:MAG: hypothetical protein M3552_03580 [Planctomycetota bacterium]|nr:hypothetical protein [Planctomycetota bacterium]